MGGRGAAAKVVRGRRAIVPAIVVPGSTTVKRQAEAEGLDRVFTDAGFEWRDSSCSMCGGSNGDIVPPGERSAFTTNRNFEGRQGLGALTHIMSPAWEQAIARVMQSELVNKDLELNYWTIGIIGSRDLPAFLDREQDTYRRALADMGLLKP